MGKKKKSRSNNNNKKNKKRNSNSNNNMAVTPSSIETAAPAIPSITSTESDDDLNIAAESNNLNHYGLSRTPPIEPGRDAMVINLKGRTDLNGDYVTIQKILSNGRVAVEFANSGTGIEIKEMLSIKFENLVAQWKEPPGGVGEGMKGEEECHICMDTIMVVKQTANFFSCCGKGICNKCWINISKQQKRAKRCPFCNTDVSILNDSVHLEHIRARAERGDPSALFLMAMYYDFGRLPQDSAMARHFYEKAAKKGHKEAATNLATCYGNGEGGPVDYVQAVHWFQIASDMGCMTATLNLCSVYLYGMPGVPRDLEKARNLIQRGVDAGYEAAVQLSKELHNIVSL